MDNLLSGQGVFVDVELNKEPNPFLKKYLDKNRPGRLLIVDACEDNACYAKSQGWDVVSIGLGESGRKKASELLHLYNMQMKYLIKGIHQPWPEELNFDVLAFMLTNDKVKKRFHFFGKMIDFVKPGAKILFEGYSINQLRHFSCINRSKHLLFSEETILDIFRALPYINIWEENIPVHYDGLYNGRASVIRMVGQR